MEVCIKTEDDTSQLTTKSNTAEENGKILTTSELNNADSSMTTTMTPEDESICYCCGENLNVAHIAGQIRCYECPKFFKTDKKFHRHFLNLHSTCTQYPCNICNAKCPTEDILQKHLLEHQNSNSCTCQKCGKRFTRKYHLQRHEEYSNCDPSKRKPKIKCKICGNEYLRTDNLQKHLREHRQMFTQTNYGTRRRGINKCVVCNKTFPSKQILNWHMDVHRVDKVLENECGKRFLQYGNGISCEKCDMQFSKKLRLIQHISEYHSRDKNIFDCNLCKTNFDNKLDLIEHIDLHENSNVSPCWICRKKILSVKLHAFCPHCKICKDYTENNVFVHEHEPMPPIGLSTPQIINWNESEEEASEQSHEPQRHNMQIFSSKTMSENNYSIEKFSDMNNEFFIDSSSIFNSFAMKREIENPQQCNV